MKSLKPLVICSCVAMGLMFSSATIAAHHSDIVKDVHKHNKVKMHAVDKAKYHAKKAEKYAKKAKKHADKAEAHAKKVIHVDKK